MNGQNVNTTCTLSIQPQVCCIGFRLVTMYTLEASWINASHYQKREKDNACILTVLWSIKQPMNGQNVNTTCTLSIRPQVCYIGFRLVTMHTLEASWINASH